jgi:hypothetical protein
LFDASERYRIGSGESRRGRLYVPLASEDVADGLETVSTNPAPGTSERLAGVRR